MKLDGKTNEELLAMSKAIEADPANRNPPGHLSIFTKTAQKKLDKIAWAITENMIAKKKADGTYVAPDGYSGMKQNRRR
jgi:hypothetical protein